ncbi:MAG: methyl-viologen-reducing hydrogenase subunit delta [Deltaproteobacteria bacterium RBG_13_49_15]|nr:MAG: methyl-viologen-reducing hydrogenase subunit delta [Deltaproteobacteria bacterium RBG_13_49_15]
MALSPPKSPHLHPDRQRGEATVKRFEPIIIAFLCNWCSYEGADSAGRARKDILHNVKPIRVMCTGRTDPQFVLEAFRNRADGILILGCHPGSCHYKDGNIQTLKRYILLQKLLPQLGIRKDRLVLDWVSSGESEKFAAIIREMVETIRELGPLPG